MNCRICTSIELQCLLRIDVIEQRALLGACVRCFMGQSGDLRPAPNQAVVGERLGSALPPFAQRVEAIAQFARRPRTWCRVGQQAPPRRFRRPSPARGSDDAPSPMRSASRRCSDPNSRVVGPASGAGLCRPSMRGFRLRPSRRHSVFLALESVSAVPYSPSSKPWCSNQATAQRLSASKSPSCSASTSSRIRLISASASRTDRGLPAASSTLA